MPRQPNDGRKNDAVRRVVDARRVFGVEIVIVLRQPRGPRVHVALAELVVLRMAPRVAVSSAPPSLAATEPLVQLEGDGVVLPFRTGGCLVHEDVAEFRKRPQQLTARD